MPGTVTKVHHISENALHKDHDPNAGEGVNALPTSPFLAPASPPVMSRDKIKPLSRSVSSYQSETRHAIMLF